MFITQWEVNSRHCGKQLNCSPIPCWPNFIYHHRNITFLIRHVMRIKRTINKGIPSIRHETKFSKWNYQLKPYHITAINITAVVSLPDNNYVLDSDYNFYSGCGNISHFYKLVLQRTTLTQTIRLHYHIKPCQSVT